MTLLRVFHPRGGVHEERCLPSLETMRLERSRLLFIAIAKMAVSKRADSPAKAFSYVHALMSQLAEPYATTHTAVHV